MKLVWIDNSCYEEFFVDDIEEVLGVSDFNIELFGVGYDATSLPDNYEIIDNKSRETLAFVRNGEVIDDPDEIQELLKTEYS